MGMHRLVVEFTSNGYSSIMSRSLRLSALLLLVGLTGCATPDSSLHMPAGTPLTRRFDLTKADLRGITLEQLRRDGAAVIVHATYGQAQSVVPLVGIGTESYGGRWPGSAAVIGCGPHVHIASDQEVRERPAPLSRTFDEVGAILTNPSADSWAVEIVAPGSYRLAMARVRMAGHIVTVIPRKLESAGIPRSAERLTVAAGDVVYAGTFVASWSNAVFNKERPRLQVLDETAGARTWAAAAMPQLASHLTTRLMPCLACDLTEAERLISRRLEELRAAGVDADKATRRRPSAAPATGPRAAAPRTENRQPDLGSCK